MDISISGHSYEISSPTTGAIRVRNPELKYGGLARYNITHVSADTSLPEFETDGDKLILINADGKVLTELTTVETPEGWQVSLSLRDGEKRYGLGDINRTRLDRRGYRYLSHGCR